MRRHHCQWTVNIYHNSHHGCYLAVKIVSNILKKAQGRKFEKELIQFIDFFFLVIALSKFRLRKLDISKSITARSFKLSQLIEDN